MKEPITRDEVAVVIKKHAMDVIDGLTQEAIDHAKTLADIGANSLDIVEIVSASMRELRVKVPRSQLMLLESLDELVDLLHKYAVAPPTPPTPPASP